MEIWKKKTHRWEVIMWVWKWKAGPHQQQQFWIVCKSSRKQTFLMRFMTFAAVYRHFCWVAMQSETEGVKGSEQCFGPTCAWAWHWGDVGGACCTGSLFGGWICRQRPHSQDGPLLSREGTDAETGRLQAELCAGPNIGRTEQCKPTTLPAHLKHSSAHWLIILLQGLYCSEELLLFWF